MPDAPARTILVVDDSPATREVLQRNLEDAGFVVSTAGGVPEALAVLEARPIDLVVTDVKMPGASGLELVRHIRENLRRTEVTVITGDPNVEGAVSAMKYGATDYLAKPFTDAELLAAVRRSLDRLESHDGAAPGVRQRLSNHGLLGTSSALDRVLDQVERAARNRATVLVTGESGTGKELVARAIHYASAQASAPFVPVNCGAIPHDLLESELFGHVKGAFTGATESRAGFFLTAEGGTVFLDEIGDTSPAMQVKLLRVLQDKEVRMVGASKSRVVDVRIVAATNKDLLALVHRGAFREDLYFRLNVISIDVPPLRERQVDIVPLAAHFASKFAAELRRRVPVFSDAVLDVLREYAWPGNVRELENVVQRLVVMADTDVIDAPDLPAAMRFSVGRSPLDLSVPLAEMERRYIRAVLEHMGGNKTRAAASLGIDRKTLREKLKEPDPS